MVPRSPQKGGGGLGRTLPEIISPTGSFVEDKRRVLSCTWSFVQIKDDIEKFKRQGVEMEEKRKSILRGLEADLTSVSEQTTAFEARFTAATKVLDQLKSGKKDKEIIYYNTVNLTVCSGISLPESLIHHIK